ncbi:MAG: gamma-glutamylcyclotransferase [Pseudomonadales bacterium]
MTHWVFGYGSLIWRPDFAYRERAPARIQGWARRFWQGSHDHRGLPHAPGRVVTLVPMADEVCEGVGYLIEEDVFAHLDEREKNGYVRHEVALEFKMQSQAHGVVYIAPQDNHAFLGPVPPDEMAAHIHGSAGPSGRNRDYLLELAAALRELGAHDEHVFDLERRVKLLD